MRRGAFQLLALSALLLAGVSGAQEAEDAGTLEVPATSDAAPAAEGAPGEATPAEEPPPGFAHQVEANGYLANRLAYGRSRFSGLISTADLPQWLDLLELNAQLKVSYHPHGFAYADVSAIAQLGLDYRSLDSSGFEQTTMWRDAPGVRPLISLNELYVLHEFAPWLNLLIGKKRLTWGASLAFNPTDLLNVRKDPTDPTFQRAGAWLARLEVPLESSAFTLLFAPQVTESAFGIPYGLLAYPDWDSKRPDTDVHYLVAARAYFLVADTDVNVMAYFSNKYLDDFANKVRLGASVSRIFFDTWEVHAEGLLQQGSARAYVEPECVASPMAAVRCAAQVRAFASRSRLTDPTWLPTAVVGVRKTFDDDSFASVEYLFQADGYRPDQYQDLVNAYDGVAQARALGVNPATLMGASLLFPQASGDGSTPSRFSFAPTAKHYAFITLNKPRIRDDFTAQLVVIGNLQDLSTLWTPSLTWSTTEWLQLQLVGFIPVPGPNALAARLQSTGRYVSEYGSFPQLFRVFFEVRLFY
ncbi:MAG: hypothetical protein IPJ65_02775 [Archangiaceae bacterium]|nr:hypothetical protein [Archangiaceae bacterium]